MTETKYRYVSVEKKKKSGVGVQGNCRVSLP